MGLNGALAEQEEEPMTDSTTQTPVLDLLARMSTDSLDASLDGAAGEIGIDAEKVRGVLAAVAPIVGTARVASAQKPCCRPRGGGRGRGARGGTQPVGRRAERCPWAGPNPSPIGGGGPSPMSAARSPCHGHEA